MTTESDSVGSSKGNSNAAAKAIGRNEPCPCGSGKKYKRCHGVDSAPVLSESKKPAMDPKALGEMAGMNPDFMMQVGQALQRLPKGQLQKLQHMMQRAMNGADVSAEAAELEKNLPPDFKNLMQGWQGMAGMPGAPGADGVSGLPASADADPMAALAQAASGSSFNPLSALGMNPATPPTADEAGTSGEMTEEEARKLVEQAALEGKISQEQATDLLGEESASKTQSSGFSKFWRGLSGKSK